MERFAKHAAAVLLGIAGVAGGWFAVKSVLSQPLPEGATFALTGLVALTALVGAYYARPWWARAPLVGVVVGVVVSVALVLVVVKG